MSTDVFPLSRAASVTDELVAAARKVLASKDGGAASQSVSSSAAYECERLVRHLSAIIGETGIRTLLKRSVHLASASFPWLAEATKNGAGPEAELHACLENQPPNEAAEAFALVLSTLLGLLCRTIGERLVMNFLHELWPVIFPRALPVKETT